MFPFCRVCFEHLVRLLSSLFYLCRAACWTEFTHSRDEYPMLRGKVRDAVNIGIETQNSSHIFLVKVTDTRAYPFNGELDFSVAPRRSLPCCPMCPIQRQIATASLRSRGVISTGSARSIQRRIGITARSVSMSPTDDNQPVPKIVDIVFDVL